MKKITLLNTVVAVKLLVYFSKLICVCLIFLVKKFEMSKRKAFFCIVKSNADRCGSFIIACSIICLCKFYFICCVFCFENLIQLTYAVKCCTHILLFNK